MTRNLTSKSESKRLTEVELELMSILWRLGEGSVNDVIGQLSKGRELAYTSVSTMLRILEQKQILKSRKNGRGHIYVPVLRKSEFESRAVQDVVEKVFDGTPSALVKQLLNSVKLSPDDLNEIKKLIDELQDMK